MKRRPNVVARIIAGLIAPLAAFCIWGVSLGTPPWETGFGLAFPMMWGAPLSVPIALALAPRRLWLALPAISLAAAAGIALQFTVVFSDSRLSDVLAIFWIIPAALGGGAALLLRYHDRLASHVGIGIIAAGVFVALAVHDRPAPGDPKYDAAARAWSEVRPGVKVFIGGDADGTSQTVCADIGTYLQYERTGKATSCQHVPHGTPVIVESVIRCTRSDPSFGYETPRARIRALDGSWHGVTTAGNFQPDIPAGTILKLHRDWGAPLSMVRDNKRINLGTAATVRLSRNDPKADPGSTLYVHVLDGAHAGEDGWTGIQLVESGDVALGAYDMAYPMSDCM